MTKDYLLFDCGTRGIRRGACHLKGFHYDRRNECSTLFWLDFWLEGRGIFQMASNLIKAVRPSAYTLRTVGEGLKNSS